MNKLTASTLLLLVAGAANAQTQVPNDFTAGTPARAAEVNANFDALETAVDQNAAAIQGIPAGPQGMQGDPGPQGVQGIPGLQGPAGADLSNEVSILQGEQAVQNDRLDAVEATVDDNAADVAVNSTGIAENTALINTNTASITAGMAASGVPVYAQGIQIGRFLSGGGDDVMLLNENGFLVPFTNASTSSPYIRQTTVYFAELNCTGNAYYPAGGNNFSRWDLAAGVIFSPSGSIPATELYYTARGSVKERDVVYASVYNNGCTDLAVPLTDTMYRVFPNDEQVTGWSITSTAGPLLLGLP